MLIGPDRNGVHIFYVNVKSNASVFILNGQSPILLASRVALVSSVFYYDRHVHMFLLRFKLDC